MTEGLLGRTFGDFALKERLGAGGAGEVYLAEQISLGRQAVIKVMAERSQASTDAQERFLREARLASRLDHPFAAHVYAFGAESDGTLWIAMELVRGTPLDRLVSSQGPVALARFVPLFERLCEVLNAAHEQNIVHRDIKPANVMVLQRAGKLLPKLLDLGIARGSVNESGAATFDADAFATASVTSISTPVSSGGSTGGEAAELITKQGSLSGRLTRSESMALTQLGSVVGTPHYMAPEQWADASRAGPKADLYALAILAFQCLTGNVPFDAKTLKAMAKAHATSPLPPLGDGLPEALHAVLAKGAAKKPEDRYGTPLEFAAALRGASGLGVEPVALPQLEEGLRDNILSEAPQPLAEAVASLEGARTARRAAESVSTVVRVLSRYLGIVSLAARIRVGPGGASEAQRLLVKLRDEGLSDAEWVELARQLVLPFKAKQEAHPLPELVRYFVDGGAKSLEDLQRVATPLKETSEDGFLQHLLHVIPRLGLVLERTAFLFDYTLVVQGDFAERWAGTRRLERRPATVATPLTRGDVALVDAVGSAVVVLPPLIQCVAPSGGAPEEMFLLEGPGRHGAKLVALPSPFERQDESLWPWMVVQGLLPEPTGAAVNTESVPYKGLSTFNTDDADNYFGREREAEAFANRMRKESFLAVVGPSGTGKSSFLLAGVLPLLPKSWKPVVLRPGATPLAALKTRLHAESLPSPEAGVDALLLSLPEGTTLVVVVDQFEELVTLCQDASVRDSFAKSLLSAARHPSGRVRVVVTLRDDFLIKVQQLPAFRETLSNSLQLLGTPAPEDLQRVVTEPARRVGYAFDDPELPKRMVDAVSDYPGALALLSFTASQLWDLRDRHLRLMRVKTYAALGGVGGALANHAEATLASLDEGEQRLVREAFRHLVTGQGTRAVLSKKEALEVLGGTAAAATVLEKLVTARLLVSSETASGDDSIEVIHEALISAWPRLVGWQREDAESARLRDSLRASARQWEERGRASGLLWRKETLTEYRLWRPRFPGKLTQLEEAFAAASIKEEARSQLLRRGLALGAFAALLITLIVVFKANREARLQIQRQWQEQGRLALVQKRPDEGLAYSYAAHAAGAANEALDTQLAWGAWAVRGMVSVVTRLSAPGQDFKISPDQRLVAVTSQRELVVTRLADGFELFRAPANAGTIAFTGDGGAVLVAQDQSHLVQYALDGTIRADRDMGRIISELDQPPAETGVYVSYAGGFFEVAEADGGLQRVDLAAENAALRWSRFSASVNLAYSGFRMNARTGFKGLEVLDGRERKAGRLFDSPVYGVVAIDSRDVVVAHANGVIRRMNLETREDVWVVQAHRNIIRSIAVDVSRNVAISISSDGSVRAFELTRGELLYVVADGEGVPLCLSLDRARGLAAIGMTSGVLKIVDLSTGREVWRHLGHRGPVTRCEVLDDRLLTLSDDGSLRTWDLGVRASQVEKGLANELHGTSVLRVSMDGGSTLDGKEVATPFEVFSIAARAPAVCSVDGARLLGANYSSTPDALLEFESDGGDFDNCYVAPSGNDYYFLSRDGARHYRGDGGAPVSEFGQTAQLALSGAQSADGRYWLAASQSGRVLVFDPETGASVSEAAAHKGSFFVQATRDASRFLTLGFDRTVREWFLTNGNLVPGRQITKLPQVAVAAELSVSGRILELVMSDRLAVYDFDRGEPLFFALYGADYELISPNERDLVGATQGKPAWRMSLARRPNSAQLQNLIECRLGVSISEETLAYSVPACTVDARPDEQPSK